MMLMMVYVMRLVLVQNPGTQSDKQLRGAVAMWSRCVCLSVQGPWVPALQRVKAMILHMTPVLVCSWKWTLGVIYLSCKNLFHNRTVLQYVTQTILKTEQFIIEE